MLYDNHGRVINYVRLAVTDRCNLRCFYCMPEEGIDYIPRRELLSYEEMERIIQLLAGMGVTKLRITGGEPFVRKGMFDFMARLAQIEGLQEMHLTTNGTLTNGRVAALKSIGLKSVNLSLDSLDKERFHEITRRDYFDVVWQTFEELINSGIKTKINAVVMEGKNIEDLIPMAELTRDYPVSIRFIEEMPFNGEGSHYPKLVWHAGKILAYLQEHYPDLYKIPDPAYSTSANYQVPGYRGSIGIIAAYSRSFCGTCNRIRLTPQGMLKTCLYDNGVFNIKDFIRNGATDEELKGAFLSALGNRAKDGFEAEGRRGRDRPVKESMSTIGG